MANGAQRRRRPAQKGVQAIFTAEDDWKGRAIGVVGLLAVGTGAALWVWAVEPLRGSAGGLVQLDVLYSSITLVSLAVPLMTGGVGLCTYFLAVRRTRRENYKIESAIYMLEELVGSKNDVKDQAPKPGTDTMLPEVQTSPRRISKSLVVGLVEAVMLIILYGGLVSEYKSNSYMREWVGANFALGRYLLNDVGPLFLTAALSGVLIFQFLVSRTRSRAPRQK